MSMRSLFRLLVVVSAVLVLFSVSQPQAQTCNGTLITPSADEATGPGQIMGGTYVNAQSSNNVREAFNETIDPITGYSRLHHRWTFSNVPAGHISLIREGYRLTTPDGDNFRFRGWYGDSEYFFFGNICPITSQTEGTQQCSLNHETYETETFHMYIEDTVQTSGTDLTAVAVDYIAICSEPEEGCNPPPGEFCP